MKNCMAIDNPRNLYLEILSSINEVHWSSSPLKHKGSLELERILTVGKNMRCGLVREYFLPLLCVTALLADW